MQLKFKILKYRVFQILIILGFSIEPQISWGLQFTQLKGFDENMDFNPEYDYLHPAHGFSLARLPLLTNMYNYPDAPEGARYDDSRAPWEPTERFVQSVFNIAPGTDSPIFFQVSPLANKAGKFMGPLTIGAILNQLHLFNDHKEDLTADKLFEVVTGEPEFAELIKKNALEVAEMNQSITAYRQSFFERHPDHSDLVGGNALATGLREAIKGCVDRREMDTQVFKDLKKSLADIQKSLRSLQEVLDDQLANDPVYKELIKKKDQTRYKAEYLTGFLDRMLNSWKAEGILPSPYPTHLTEQILLAMAWNNTPDHEKGRFVDLYASKIPWSLRTLPVPGAWLDSALPDKSQYSLIDYRDIMKKLASMSEETRADYLLNHLVETAFIKYGERFFELDRVPELGYTTAKVTASDGRHLEFSDCMDSSILNFLAILARDPMSNQFSIDPICQSKPEKCTPSLAFQEFLSHFTSSTASDFESIAAHNRWAKLIGEIPGAVYVGEKGYEIDTSVDNIFTIFKHHLFPTLGEPIPKVIDPATGPAVDPIGEPVVDEVVEMSRAEKMTQLCELLSHPHQKVEWNLRGATTDKQRDRALNSSSTQHIIDFSVNGVEKFTWMIQSGHAEIKAMQSSLPSIFTQRVIDLIKSEDSAAGVLSDRKAKTLLWLDPEGKQEKLDHLPALSYLLSNVESKISLLKQEIAHSPSRRHTVLRIVHSLPQNDIHTQVAVIDALYENRGQSDFLHEFERIYAFLHSTPHAAQSAILDAVQNNQWNAVFWLIENFPECVKDYKDDRGNTLGHLLASSQKLPALKFLAQRIPEVMMIINRSGKTPAHLAIEKKALDVFEVIVQHAPKSLEVKDFDRRTPVENADNGRFYTIYPAIARYAPDFLRKEQRHRSTYLDSLITFEKWEVIRGIIPLAPELMKDRDDSLGHTKVYSVASKDGTELAQWIAEHYPDLMRQKNRDGSTVAHRAARENNWELVRTIARYTPEILEERDSYGGLTPAHLAAQYNAVETLQAIAELAPHRMKDRDSSGNEPVHQAAYSGQLSALQWIFLNIPGSIEEKCSYGMTPTQIAARLKHWDVLLWIAQHYPAAMKEVNKDGKTPLDIAREHAAPNLIELERLTESMVPKN